MKFPEIFWEVRGNIFFGRMEGISLFAWIILSFVSLSHVLCLFM